MIAFAPPLPALGLSQGAWHVSESGSRFCANVHVSKRTRRPHIEKLVHAFGRDPVANFQIWLFSRKEAERLFSSFEEDYQHQAVFPTSPKESGAQPYSINGFSRPPTSPRTRKSIHPVNLPFPRASHGGRWDFSFVPNTGIKHQAENGTRARIPCPPEGIHLQAALMCPLNVKKPRKTTIQR